MDLCHLYLMAEERESWMGTSIHQHDTGLVAVTLSIFYPSWWSKSKCRTGALGYYRHSPEKPNLP